MSTPMVKICGISRNADIEYVNRYLPEYVGFVFADSKRMIAPEKASALISYLHDSVGKAGVFVNEQIARVADISAICGLDIIQLHGDETPQYVRELKQLLLMKRPGIKIWKALRVKGTEVLGSIHGYNVDGFVLDAYVDRVYGGAGKTFDWEVAVEARRFGTIILAGGLVPENVCEAIRLVNPFAVDVSSGVETAGVKDEVKIRSFIYNARNNVY